MHSRSLKQTEQVIKKLTEILVLEWPKFKFDRPNFGEPRPNFKKLSRMRNKPKLLNIWTLWKSSSLTTESYIRSPKFTRAQLKFRKHNRIQKAKRKFKNPKQSNIIALSNSRPLTTEVKVWSTKSSSVHDRNYKSLSKCKYASCWNFSLLTTEVWKFDLTRPNQRSNDWN